MAPEEQGPVPMMGYIVQFQILTADKVAAASGETHNLWSIIYAASCLRQQHCLRLDFFCGSQINYFKPMANSISTKSMMMVGKIGIVRLELTQLQLILKDLRLVNHTVSVLQQRMLLVNPNGPLLDQSFVPRKLLTQQSQFQEK